LEDSKILLFGYPELDDVEKTLKSQLNEDIFEKINYEDSDSDSDKEVKKKNSLNTDGLAYCGLAYCLEKDKSGAFKKEPSSFTIKGMSSEEEKKNNK